MTQFVTKELEYEYLIIGAGPAGLQLGYYLEQQKRKYIVLERGYEPGNFYTEFPRHKKLISINKVYTGYNNSEINLKWDWNSLLSDREDLLFKNYSKEYFPKATDLVKYLNDFASKCNLNIRYGVQIEQVSKNNGFHVIDHLGNVYVSKRLIIATGLSIPYVPQIPGIEMAENYKDVSIAPEDFQNQDVLIIGKGNSAFETADNLIATAAKIHLASPHPIRMAWKTHFVGNLRAVNNNILDTYQLKSQNAILDATILKIERQEAKFLVTFKYSHAHGEIEEILYDHIIACTGFKFDDSIFDETCKPELAIYERFPKQTSEWESTNVKDMYFIGTLMQMRDYKKYMSGFIHGFRYNIHALSKIFAYKYHTEDLPSQSIEKSPEAIARATIDRINISSALWQQPGFICDLIVLPTSSHHALYYQDLPVDYVREKMMSNHYDYFLITLEYGKSDAADPFNVERIERSDKGKAELSNFLHPIIRQYRDGQLISEHHIIEDLAGEWLENEHVVPLIEYCKQQMSSTKSVVSGVL